MSVDNAWTLPQTQTWDKMAQNTISMVENLALNKNNWIVYSHNLATINWLL